MMVYKPEPPVQKGLVCLFSVPVFVPYTTDKVVRFIKLEYLIETVKYEKWMM